MFLPKKFKRSSRIKYNDRKGTIIKCNDEVCEVKFDDGEIETVPMNMISEVEDDCVYCLKLNKYLVNKKGLKIKFYNKKLFIKMPDCDPITLTCNYCPICGRKF